jgi:hypothetical protein
MWTEEFLHLSEIVGWRQIANFAPLVIRRKTVISSALDVESKEIESERSIFTLEQMISHLE